MALQFSDEQFQEAWRELDDPRLEGGWELFTSSMGIQIYRLYDQDSGLYEYKIFGSLADYPPDVCAAVYMDLEYRKHWDGYVKALGESPMYCCTRKGNDVFSEFKLELAQEKMREVYKVEFAGSDAMKRWDLEGWNRK
ncbi:PPCT protein, partial [Polypterus senegalus]